jgi:hypothetical protein
VTGIHDEGLKNGLALGASCIHNEIKSYYLAVPNTSTMGLTCQLLPVSVPFIHLHCEIERNQK